MDTDAALSLLKESAFVLAVFGVLLVYAFARGRQAITNLILGLYLALLITLKFPYFDVILSNVADAHSQSMVMIAIFLIFATLATILFSRLLPREYDEGTFEAAGKKFVFALAATILVMAYSYHALPVTEFVDPGSPIQSIFAPEQGFFLWLLVPLVLLFIL
ncbi:MAG: hypothetical protein WDZ93_00125 [Candidatus Paceibacterota bacterium]